MPLPALLAAAQLASAAGPSLMKGIAGLFQLKQEVKKRDTTPDAFKESLALTRQQAATNRLPGEGQAVDRIMQGTAAVNAGALRAGGSSSDVLASLQAADAQQKMAWAGLSQQGAAYQQQQQGALKQGLAQQAAYQQRDQETQDKEQGALKEAGLKNVFGAVDGLGQIGAWAINKYGGGGSADSDAPPVPGSAKPRRSRATAAFGPVPAGMRGMFDWS